MDITAVLSPQPLLLVLSHAAYAPRRDSWQPRALQFHAMCAHIGVDPLASNKSAVNKWLDFKDWSFAGFYYALGVSVVEVRAARALPAHL
jgi:EAP30/Vps36 family